MNFDFATLAVVFLGSTIIGAIALLGATSQWQRILLLGVLAGFFLYSGIGAAYPEVPDRYLVYYFGLLIGFVTAFTFFRVSFLDLSRLAGLLFPPIFRRISTTAAWRWVVIAYLLLQVIPLMYPEFRLAQLIAPQPVALPELLATRWDVHETNSILKLTEYAWIVLTPFFYIALFRYANRMFCVALILFLQLYISFVVDGYIGRYEIAIALGVIALALWVSRPRHRGLLILCSVALLPLVLMGAYAYAVIRIGGTVQEMTLIEAVKWLWQIETSFPLTANVIIESGFRANLADYVRWMLTLPIPKILVGEVQTTHINWEISELVLDVSRGERGFYIVLPGLVGESVYLYGPSFFWIHGVFVGFVAALVIRILERTPQFLFLNAYVVMLFAFVLNRAGVDGALPYLVNYLLLFYVFVFVILLEPLLRTSPAGKRLRNLNGVSEDASRP